MFDITTVEDFLAKLEAEYADFKAQPDSTRHALNCIMTAYHLHEWVWGDWLKTDHQTWKKIGGIRGRDSFKVRLADLWPDIILVKELTNGTKHFGNANVETARVAGYGRGPYGVGPCGKAYLLIDLGSSSSPRYQTAEQLIDGAVAFWRGFFNTYFRAQSNT